MDINKEQLGSLKVTSEEDSKKYELSAEIYDFIKSSACAKHCRAIGHVFEPIDMAEIILRSDLPMQRRHKALAVLLADGEARKKLEQSCLAETYCPNEIPYYEYIERTMKFERTSAEHFIRTQRGWVFLDYLNTYSTLPNALAHACKNKDCVETFYIVKQRLNKPGEQIAARVSREGTVIAIEPEDEEEENACQIKCGWEYFPIDRVRIPTPFKHGDIIQSTEFRYGDLAVVNDATPGRESVFRLKAFPFGWHIEHKNLGDSVLLSDYDSFSGELSGGNRVLSYLSDFHTGKIRLDEYEDAVRAMGRGGDSGIFIPDIIVI